MTNPGQTYAVSIFIEQFVRELGLSRALLSTLYTAGTLGGWYNDHHLSHCQGSSTRLATAWRLRVARPFKAGLPGNAHQSEG